MLSNRCPPDVLLPFANLCSACPDILHSSCVCLPMCSSWFFFFSPRPNCCFSSWRSKCLSSNWMLFAAWLLALSDRLRTLLLSWRSWNPCLKKKIVISYCLLEKLLACTCRWPARDLKKRNWILSSLFSPGFKMSRAGIKNGSFLRGLCLP